MSNRASVSNLPSLHVLARAIEQQQQCVNHGGRVWRTTRHIDVYCEEFLYTMTTAISTTAGSAGHSAGSHRHHPARLRHGVIRLHQRTSHRIGDGTGHEQEIRKARRRRKENSQPMQVVIRVIQRL